jgi:hypothetical protein
MEAAPRKHAIFYRCAARALLPSAGLALEHPPTVCVRENHLVRADQQVDRSAVRASASRRHRGRPGGAEEVDQSDEQRAVARRRVAEADATMNAAAPDKRAAEAALAAIEPTQQLTADDIPKLLAELGNRARPGQRRSGERGRALQPLGPAITYDAQTRADVIISPRGVTVSEGGHAP